MTATEKHIIELIEAHTKDMFAYTLSKVRQKEAAEDLVQDSFVAAYQAYDKFQGKSSEKTWLFSILKRKIADYYRIKIKKDIEVSSDMMEQYFDRDDRWKLEYRPTDWGHERELLDDPDFANALKQCFDQLPEKWSSAFSLKYLKEHDADGICSELEITKPNFWQIIHRAKLQLRNCLEMRWFKK